METDPVPYTFSLVGGSVAEPGNLVKIVAAFVGGVVVALGGSLIYVRVHDASHGALITPPAQVAQTKAPEPVAPTETEDQPSPPTEHVTAPPHPKPIQHPKIQHRSVERPKPVLVARTEPVIEPAPAKGDQGSPALDPAPVNPAIQKQTDEPAPVPARPDPAPAPAYQPHVVTLQPGTNLNIRLGETISTDNNYSGDTFRGVLDMPVIADGFVIADKGSKVLGRIVSAQRAGRVQGTASLSVTLTEINTTDGQQVRVETNTIENGGPSSRRRDAEEIAGAVALGAVIGALSGGGKGAAIGAGAGGAAGTGAVLFTRGIPARLLSETRLNFQLTTPVTITERLNN